MIMTKKNKTAFVTFSSKYLKTKTTPTYQDFVLVVKNTGFNILHEWFNKKNGRKPEKVHAEALDAIREADCLIAEASIDSIGVGQQITYAIQKRKPVIICMKASRAKNNNLTFLKGTKSSKIEFVYYKTLEDLGTKLKQLFDEKEESTLEKFNFIATSQLKAIISEESQKQQISQSELLRSIVKEWVVKHKLK